MMAAPRDESDMTTTAIAAENVGAAPHKRRSSSRTAYWLLAPGIVWMVLFLVVPILMMVYVSFWTSFLIRVLAWRPMLGKEGAINLILLKLNIISTPIEALLFSDLSVVIGMTQIYCVFMVGPIAFMLGRIDPNVIEAARDLGAGFWRIFRTIILPLSMPGVIVGAIFVSVMVLGEFATSAALSGRKVNMLGNIIVTQVGSLKWAFAAVVGAVLTVLMGLVVAGLLRIVDLRKEL